MRFEVSDATICEESVSDYIALHDLDRELQKAIDSTKTVSWRKWAQEVDTSLAYAPSTKPLEYCLERLGQLYADRQRVNIGALLVDNAMDPASAIKALEALEDKHGKNGTLLSVMTPSQIINHPYDPKDLILLNGYLEKGSPCVMCGPPGIGKSRVMLQLAVKTALGQGFIGWETQGSGLKWLILQNENSVNRLRADLAMMEAEMTAKEKAIIDEHIIIHVLLTDLDGYLNLGEPEVRERILKTINHHKPHIVVGDPLSAFSQEDLNSDKEMLNTARDFGRLVHTGDPKRTPLLLHHSRTGKAGAASVTGMDRANFARNSKALYGWTRAQINLTPFNENNNDTLIVASGKCNNAQEFEPFTIELDTDSMTYSRVEANIEEWKERINTGGKFQKTFSDAKIREVMSKSIPLKHAAIFQQVRARTDVSYATFNRHWKDMKMAEEIKEIEPRKWVLV